MLEPTLPTTMQALVLTELGSLEHLSMAEIPVPRPVDDEVLIKVVTVAANRQDLNLILGHFKVPGLPMPHVLGLDPAGVVVGVGEAVVDIPIGARVVAKPPIACGRCTACLEGEDDACERITSLGIHRPGGMAEYVAVPQQNVFVMPDGLGFADATAVAHSVPVALTLLRRVAVSAGEAVLVSGASGAIGSAAVQLAKGLGAHVIALVGREQGAAWLAALSKRLAPDNIIDYVQRPDFARLVRELRPAGIDLYVETASDPVVWSEAMGTLARRARVAVIGAHAGPVVPTNNNWLFRQRVSIIGCSGSTLASFADALALAGQGQVLAHLDSISSSRDAQGAYARLLGRQNHGKMVLRVAPDPA